MKNTMKIIAIAVIAIMLVAVSTNVLAANTLDYGGIINSVENNASNGSSNEGVNKIAGQIVGLIRNIAVVAGVILLSIIGIKFMLGSAEEKAEYKKSLIPLVVGIIVVMAASQIIAMIFGFFA